MIDEYSEESFIFNPLRGCVCFPGEENFVYDLCGLVRPYGTPWDLRRYAEIRTDFNKRAANQIRMRRENFFLWISQYFSMRQVKMEVKDNAKERTKSFYKETTYGQYHANDCKN